MDKYDLSYEKRLLDLLGYEYIEDTPGKWKVLDDNKKNVGYIEAYIDTDKEDTPYTKRDEYVYHMVIDSDTIHYDNKRELDEQIYFFDIKKDGKIEYDVFMQLGDKHLLGCDDEFITIYNKDSLDNFNKRKCIRILKNFDSCEYGIVNEHINGIGIDYCYPINGYTVEEDMWFRNKDFDEDSNLTKYYEYRLLYHPEEDSDEREGYELSSTLMIDRQDELFTYKRIFEKQSVMLRKERELNGEDENGNKKTKLHLFKEKRKHYFPPEVSYPTESKTPEEFALEHKRGIEIFKHGVDVVNQLLPFKKDIISEYFKDYIDEYNLGIFFDNEKKKVK